MSKRIPFDREQQTEITDTTEEIIRDNEPILDNWERVYTIVSIVDQDNPPTKIRFGTGGEDKPRWHEEEPAPIADEYVRTGREYHCRALDRGLVGIYGATAGDRVVVNWHGYDKKIGGN